MGCLVLILVVIGAAILFTFGPVGWILAAILILWYSNKTGTKSGIKKAMKEMDKNKRKWN